MGILLSRSQCRVAANAEADLSSRLFTAYLRAPYLQHIGRNSAELNRNVYTACADISQNVVLSVLIIGSNLFTIVILVAVIGLANAAVTAASVVYFAFVAYIYLRVVSPRSRRAGGENIRLSGIVIRSSQEGFHGLKAFQAADAVEAVADDYKRRRSALAHYRYQNFLLLFCRSTTCRRPDWRKYYFCCKCDRLFFTSGT